MQAPDDDNINNNITTSPYAPPPMNADTNEYEMLRAVLSARDNEIAMLCARLQQNNESLAAVVEQLERTVSASIDRFIRRIDRMDNRLNRSGSYDNNNHRSTDNDGGGGRNKRSRYSSRML